MVRKLMVAMAALLLFTAADAGEVQDYKNVLSKYKAWNRLCIDYAHATDRSCDGLRAPKVTYEKMRKGLNGYYEGKGTVFINKKLRGREQEATIIHEMSHYLDTMLGLNPRMPVYSRNKPAIYKLCYSEKRAWDVTDEYLRDVGARRKAADGKWVTWYSHCRQFADKLYPDLYPEPLPVRARSWWGVLGI